MMKRSRAWRSPIWRRGSSERHRESPRRATHCARADDQRVCVEDAGDGGRLTMYETTALAEMAIAATANRIMMNCPRDIGTGCGGELRRSSAVSLRGVDALGRGGGGGGTSSTGRNADQAFGGS